MSLYIILIICLVFSIIALLVWVTQLRKNLKDHFIIERELQYEIGHDALTDLVSSSVAIDRLSQSMKNAKRYGNKIAVIYIGVDYFKQINTPLDFDITNEFLQALSNRFLDVIGRIDTVCRENEDEFIVILEDVEDTDSVREIIEKLMKISNEIFEIQHHKIKSTFSIGVSMFPLDDAQTMSILSHANSAMLLAKDDGGDAYQFYTRELSQQAFESLKLEHELIDSIKNNQIEVNYQLIYNTKTKVSIGMEAYARWRHPVMGLIPADKFINLSTEIGYIIEIDRWILKETIEQVKRYKEVGIEIGTLFLNTSLSTFGDISFMEDIRTLIVEDKLLSSDVYFEITQGQVSNQNKKSMQTIDELSALGIKFSIDNCGNSHFSFKDMKSLPLSMLKIDRSLVSNLEENKNSIKSILAIAQNMGLSTTANGVQTEEEYSFLLENGCENIQGDYFHEASDSDTIEAILKT